MSKRKGTRIESYLLKSGEKRYKFQIYIGINPLTGKEERTTRAKFKTKKEAQLALARIRLQIDNGTFRKQQIETYQDLYNLWIKQYEHTVEESTYVKTFGIFKNHILPAMGKYKIDRINVDVCQQNVTIWARKLKNYRMVKSYAAKVLDFAIGRGFIQTNPFSIVDIPNNIRKNDELVGDKIENFYTREQLIEFLSCLAEDNNHKAFALFRLLAFSGMRKGEALALRWNDFNFESNEVRINKALSRGKENKLYVKTTKTGVARTIMMDEKTMTIMIEWKEKQKQENLILGFNTSHPKQLVFSNNQNEYLQPTMTRKWITFVQNKFNLSAITTHGLRHTHCSLLFEAGASLKEVQDRLGHSDVQTTLNIYTHVSQKAKEEAINKFENYLNI